MATKSDVLLVTKKGSEVFEKALLATKGNDGYMPGIFIGGDIAELNWSYVVWYNNPVVKAVKSIVREATDEEKEPVLFLELREDGYSEEIYNQLGMEKFGSDYEIVSRISTPRGFME